jgi:hypothetical protein
MVTLPWSSPTIAGSGEITGKVTGAQTGAPFSGIQVKLIDTTMTTTTIILSDDLIDNVLPVNGFTEILQTSVTIQSMRGANKSGVAYLIDGVNITDMMTAFGGGADVWTLVNRNTNRFNSTTGEFTDLADVDVRGRSSDMVQTSIGINQLSAAEVSMSAGTFDAEYNASAGIIQIATKSGGKNHSGKLYIRSSAGGLDHAGPDCYTATSPNPDIFNGKSAADLYAEHRANLLNNGGEYYASKMNWTPDTYGYGEDPRITSEFTLGGPLRRNGNFFFSGHFLNDHGRFPGEFQRNLGLSLKLSYDISESDRLTGFSKLDDWGQIFGWTNRSYSYRYQFWLEGQPVWDRSAFVSYLKHTHAFNPSSLLESTISYISNEKTWGYKPRDGELEYDNYGNDWLILDTREEAERYLIDYSTRIFIASPGGDPLPTIPGFFNQVRFGFANYYYENLYTNTLSLALNYTNRLNIHHNLKSGVEYKRNSIDELQHRTTVPSPDPYFKFDTVDYEVHPWSLGMYIQDKIEYDGITVNLGLRFDVYNPDTRFWEDYSAPSEWDTTTAGQAVLVWDKSKNSRIHKYLSPRLGVCHPISGNAAMHYSWGIYTTRPYPGYWLTNYGSFVNSSVPATRNPDPDPEKAIAYDVGIHLALTDDIGMDITAYYRDVRNGSALQYSITPDETRSGIPFRYYTYTTNWGYRDSRGVEINLWKRPAVERWFGIFGLSGNLSLSWSYDKTSVDASHINQEADFTTTLTPDNVSAAYDWSIGSFWPTYSRGYNDVKAKMALVWDFLFEFKMGTVATYRSPWRFPRQLNIINPRYEEMLDGEAFFRIDLRLIKYFPVRELHGGLFLEVLNVLNRENILTFDNFNNNNYYEAGLGPYGVFNRPTDQYGSPLADIAREIYLGFELSF